MNVQRRTRRSASQSASPKHLFPVAPGNRHGALEIGHSSVVRLHPDLFSTALKWRRLTGSPGNSFEFWVLGFEFCVVCQRGSVKSTALTQNPKPKTPAKQASTHRTCVESLSCPSFCDSCLLRV